MTTKNSRQKDSSPRTTIHIANGKIAGTSYKGPLGGEIYLDKDGRYAGTKRKGILGEEHYFDSDGNLAATSREGLAGSRIITDNHGQYVATSYKGPGGTRLTILDGNTDPQPKHTSPAAWIFFGVAVCFFIVVMLIVFK